MPETKEKKTEPVIYARIHPDLYKRFKKHLVDIELTGSKWVALAVFEKLERDGAS